jgi:hypothetical protein
MDRYSKRSLRIFQFLALFIIVIGLIMMMINAHAVGKVGQGKTSQGHIASLNGFQIIFVGVIMLAMSFLLKKDK